MKKLIDKLFDQQNLSKTEAKLLLTYITDGTANDAQIVAAISALKMRTLSSEELNGFREALLEQAVPINLYTKEAIDVCGTGGDGKDTFNISTLAAVVIAGAGYKVIKHGNYGVSSSVGSSTILNECGYSFSNKEDQLNEELEKSNMCFLHAPLFHPALKKVGPIRKDLGVRTFFNFLGPLVNPVQPKYQLTGVYNLQLMRIYKQILTEERTAFKIVHSLDGYDEVSLTGPVKIVSNLEDAIVFPDEFKQEVLTPETLASGSSATSSSKIFFNVLEGQATTAQTSVVLVNAALGIQCFDNQKTFSEALNEAKYAINSGAALSKFKLAIELSNKIKAEKS